MESKFDLKEQFDKMKAAYKMEQGDDNGNGLINKATNFNGQEFNPKQFDQ